MIRHCFKGIFCLLLFQTNGFSQTTHPDTTFIAQSIQHSIALYTREIGGQTHLYNGSEYHEYKSVNGEDPYFINEWIEGEIKQASVESVMLCDDEFGPSVVSKCSLKRSRVIPE